MGNNCAVTSLPLCCMGWVQSGRTREQLTGEAFQGVGTASHHRAWGTGRWVLSPWLRGLHSAQCHSRAAQIPSLGECGSPWGWPSGPGAVALLRFPLLEP